jgi:hypothetical protein
MWLRAESFSGSLSATFAIHEAASSPSEDAGDLTRPKAEINVAETND